MIPFQLYRLLLAASLAMVFSGCGSPEPEESQPTPPESTSEPLAGPQRTAPADATAPASAEDEAAQSDAVARARSERQALRERRREQLNWWEDSDLARELGLEAHQREALLAAREELQRTRVDTRERLRNQRELQRQAERDGDHDRLADVRARASALQQQLREASQLWDQRLRDTLSEDQLEQLIDRQPDALAPDRSL